MIQQLYDELSQGLAFHPPCHVGDEWFVPVGIPAIFIPFLSHARPAAAAQTQNYSRSRGEIPEWFMKLIRHGLAHAYAYAYQFVRKRKWRAHVWKIFLGRNAFVLSSASAQPRLREIYSTTGMPEAIPTRILRRPLPCGSRRGLDWRARYKDLEGAAKVEYVDELMRSLAGQPPLPMPEYRVADYDCLNVKLKTYYARKRKDYEHSFPDFYDNDLRQLFVPSGDLEVHVASRLSASAPARAGKRRLPVDERK